MGNRPCLPPAGNEPRESGRIAKNTLFSSGSGSLQAPRAGCWTGGWWRITQTVM